MNYSKVKIIVCCVWVIGVIGISLLEKSNVVNASATSNIPKPNLKEVEKFNALILDRFLNEPGFGFGRMVPIPQPALHLLTYNSQIGKAEFSPKEGDEKKIVAKFEQKNWKVGLYLFGKSANTFAGDPRVKIGYRLFKPIAVTKNIGENDLTNPEKLLDKTKEAFDEFQLNEKERIFEFNQEDWWYLAKPVRAVNQSCVDCHTDNLVPKAFRNGEFTFRTRKIGDVNGILVYAFQKIKK